MKFKALFITFNIVLFFSFLTIIFLPFLIMDGSFMSDFWSKNWFFCIIFVSIIALVNFVFLSHWKMLAFLEKEDWPGLSQYLENAVLVKKRFGKRNVRLLCDSLLLLGDFDTLDRLESVLRQERPALLASVAVKFAAAGLLSGKFDRLQAFTTSLASEKGADRDWLLFYAAFSRHLSKQFPEAADGLIKLASSAKDPLVTALSGYLCGVLLTRKDTDDQEALLSAAKEAKARLQKTYHRTKWDSYIEETKAEMHVVVLGKLVEETGTWLFSGPK